MYNTKHILNNAILYYNPVIKTYIQQYIIINYHLNIHVNHAQEDKCPSVYLIKELSNKYARKLTCTLPLPLFLSLRKINELFIFSVPLSPGGVAYEREVHPPDWVLDYWHPWEKASYPEYFAKREQRKKEYVEWWEKTYGKPAEQGH